MEFKIARTSPTCRACSRAFRDEETLITALKQPGEETFERFDICNACWPKENHDAYRCFWSNSFSAKRRSPLLDADVLWQVFYHCQPKAEESPEAAEFAYVAALGLMRLKYLVLERTEKKKGTEFLVLRTRGDKKDRVTYEVRDPNLDVAGVERVQDKLGEFESVAAPVADGAKK